MGEEMDVYSYIVLGSIDYVYYTVHTYRIL